MIADTRRDSRVADDEAFAERLELFFGEATDTLCRVYARLAGLPADGDARLTGTLAGPQCEYAHTLPATFALADRGPGDSLLAEAVIPEPCFWSPDLPNLYQVQVELRRGSEVVATAARLFGIRPLGVRGASLNYHHKRWVLRGVSRSVAPQADLADWRDHGAAMFVTHPDDSLCERASRSGVLLVAELSGRGDHVASELRRLSRWPAVGVVVLKSGPRPSDELGRVARNILLAERVSENAVQRAPWAQLAMVELSKSKSDLEALRKQIGGCALPAMIFRPADVPGSIADARALCDRLQRDAAAIGDFAGYIV